MLCSEYGGILGLCMDLLIAGEMGALLIGSDGIFHFVGAFNKPFAQSGFIAIFYY